MVFVWLYVLHRKKYLFCVCVHVSVRHVFAQFTAGLSMKNNHCIMTEYKSAVHNLG